ncbi:MAG: UDP-glucose 4-epimerase GalE [Polyangiales bacterium]
MTTLVTGGAGYVGSTFVERLLAEGEPVVVLDDLSRGHRDAVPAGATLCVGRVGDGELVKRVVAAHGVDACAHFAGFIAVGESVAEPLRYYENNLAEGVSLLGALVASGVGRVIFSSTAAVYGSPADGALTEDAPLRPENPYGRTKLAFERCLADVAAATGLRHVTFRYFNAAGATAGCRERHEPETHLVPNALRAARGELPALRLFGTDFPTRDGTCERDYVHVADLADAHWRALGHLRAGGASLTLNLGGGVGHTVREVIAAVARVTGRRVPVAEEGRRAGDPARLVADITRAGEALGWRPTQSELDAVIASAWRAFGEV